MTKTIYYNYLIAENESVIKTLSDLGFSGKYELLDGKLYVYFQKDGKTLSIPKIGKISNKNFREILDNKAVFIEKKNIEFENSFGRFNPEKTFTQQALYCSKMKKYFWWK